MISRIKRCVKIVPTPRGGITEMLLIKLDVASEGKPESSKIYKIVVEKLVEIW